MTESKQSSGTSQGTNPSQLAASLFQNTTTQVGSMVASIVVVGQAFAALDIHSAAAPLAAFVFSALLAVYQVSILQKTPRNASFVLVPIATLTLFALAWGGNDSLGQKPLKDQLALAKQELELTKKYLKNQTLQTENSDAFINKWLPQDSALDENSKNAPVSPNAAAAISQTWVDAPLGLFVPRAWAQGIEHNRERNREGVGQAAIRQEYQRFRERQQELTRQQQALEKQRQQLQQRQEQERRQRGRWFWQVWSW